MRAQLGQASTRTSRTVAEHRLSAIEAPDVVGLGGNQLALGAAKGRKRRHRNPHLPSALLVALLAVPRLRWQPAALVGVLTLAGWSIWWERDYLGRRAALWQAGQALVERGIPPDEIDGGYEWIGWHRGQTILAAAPDLVEPDGIGRNLENYVSDSMNMRRARWAVAYELPQGVPESRVLASVPYGHGQRVVAVQRY